MFASGFSTVSRVLDAPVRAAHFCFGCLAHSVWYQAFAITCNLRSVYENGLDFAITEWMAWFFSYVRDP